MLENSRLLQVLHARMVALGYSSRVVPFALQ